MWKLVISCWFVLVLVSPSYATVIGDWEGSLDGWQVSNPYSFSTIGVTNGNYSLRLETPDSWWNEAMAIDLAQIEGGRNIFFAGNDRINIYDLKFSVDVTLLAREWNDAGTGWHTKPQIQLLLNWSDSLSNERWWNLGAWNGYPNGSYDPSTMGDGKFTATWNYFQQAFTIREMEYFHNSISTKFQFVLEFEYSQYNQRRYFLFG
jgi:hypothetical protein